MTASTPGIPGGAGNNNLSFCKRPNPNNLTSPNHPTHYNNFTYLTAEYRSI